MPKASYISTHGMIWGEISDSGGTTSYGHDALGSVVETYANGALENTYRYTPYGKLLAKTGASPDPSWLWNGANGYRSTSLRHSEFYVRRRHYSSATALWTASDQLWPFEHAYAYAFSSPTVVVDPSGLSGGCSIIRFPAPEENMPSCAAQIDRSGGVTFRVYKPVTFNCTGRCSTVGGAGGKCRLTQRYYLKVTLQYPPGKVETLVDTSTWATADGNGYVADGEIQCSESTSSGASAVTWTLSGIDEPGPSGAPGYTQEDFSKCQLPTKHSFVPFQPTPIASRSSVGILTVIDKFKTTCSCAATTFSQSGVPASQEQDWSFNWGLTFSGFGSQATIDFNGECGTLYA